MLKALNRVAGEAMPIVVEFVLPRSGITLTIATLASGRMVAVGKAGGFR